MSTIDRQRLSRLAATVACLLACLLASQPAGASDIAFGEYLAGECVTCHQRSGKASGIPAITGWPRESFVAVMNSYKSRERDNVVMQTIAGRLSAEETSALAAYFESLGAQASAR